MPKFFNHDLADLAHQLTLSPRRLRVGQILAIDRLLGKVEPDRAYPFEFICHAITSYRKRGPAGATASVPGKALIGDLVTMAEVISRKANLTVEELGHPYRTHQEVADELNVSTKTIRRWRNRGLMGIRVVFEDGVNRLAFFQGTIDRFVKQHASVVAKGASFKQLTQAERKRIVERARALRSQRPLKLHAAACIIAEEIGRAVETVRYTLRRYDESHRTKAVFADNGESLLCERYEAIRRCSESGEPVSAIAKAFDCNKAEIEDILRKVRLHRWQQTPLEWVHNELFDAPDADALILDRSEPPPSDVAPTRPPRDVPGYLRSLYLTPLLTAEQEQDLFRRYNYLKCKAASALKGLEVEELTASQFKVVEHLMAKVDTIRRRIIRANLRLVVSIAKRHVGRSANFFEIVSDGNVSLMRAVEKFDYARGNKFSTYATWAIMKNYARSIPEQQYRAARYVTGQDEMLAAKPDHRAETVDNCDRRHVRRMLQAGLDELPDREREIVTNHFGLGAGAEPQTLEQLGTRFGVTKERIRQIEQRALAQLRETLSPNLVDAITA